MAGGSRTSFLRRVAVDVQPLRYPDFRRLFVGQGVAFVGFQLTAVAVAVQMYDVTGSSLWVGLLGVAALVPLVVLGLVPPVVYPVAFGVTLFDVLPSLPQMSLISASSSGGVCSGNPNVSCGMGTIVQGDTATVLLIVKSLQPGLTINKATATVDTVLTLDPVPDNNQFGKPVRIRP